MEFLNDPPIVIAEIGNNHGGNLELAKQMVVAAVKTGTPYLKFQTMIPERLLSRDHPAFEEFAREALSFDDFRALRRFCKENGAVFLSTPFDPESADMLEELDVAAFKISSGDLTYISLLRHVACKHRPILLSTGASTFDDIDNAVEIIRSESDAELILLHCTAAYPCPDEEANLAVIPELAKRYGCQVGFSDHTLGIEIALAAVALGAIAIEKHFTIDRLIPGGDNQMSILPEELKLLSSGVRRVQMAMGSCLRQKTQTELKGDAEMHRSLVVRHDMKAEQVIEAKDLDALRPGGGISPAKFEEVVDKKLRVDIDKGKKLLPEHLV